MPRPRSFDEERVLARAMMRFWQHGYTATSIKHLEAATELAPGSLYNSFGSKDGLFLAALDHYIDNVMGTRIHKFLCEPYPGEAGVADDPLAGVETFFTNCFTGRARELQLGCLVVNTSTELGPHDEAIRERIYRAAHEVTRGLQEALARAQAQGALDPQIDTGRRAQLLGLLLNGMLVQSRTSPDNEWLEGAMDGVRRLLQ